MVDLQVELSFAARDRSGRMLPPEELHAHGAALMEALLDLEKCNDTMQNSATSTDAEAGEVVVELVVSARSDFDAMASALILSRTAVQAIGGLTRRTARFAYV